MNVTQHRRQEARWPKAITNVAWGNAPGVRDDSNRVGRRPTSTCRRGPDEYGLRPTEAHTRRQPWGVAPGYGDRRPSAKQILGLRALARVKWNCYCMTVGQARRQEACWPKAITNVAWGNAPGVRDDRNRVGRRPTSTCPARMNMAFGQKRHARGASPGVLPQATVIGGLRPNRFLGCGRWPALSGIVIA